MRAFLLEGEGAGGCCNHRQKKTQAVYCSVVQCVAVCCSVVLQPPVEENASCVLQCNAVWCSVVQRLAVSCSVFLQPSAGENASCVQCMGHMRLIWISNLPYYRAGKTNVPTSVSESNQIRICTKSLLICTKNLCLCRAPWHRIDSNLNVLY